MEELFNNADIRGAVIAGIVVIVGAIFATGGSLFLWLRRRLESSSTRDLAESQKEQAEAKMMNTINDLVVKSSEERQQFLTTLNKHLDAIERMHTEIANLRSEISNMKTEMLQLKEENTKLKTRVKTLETENAELNKRLTDETNKRVSAEKLAQENAEKLNEVTQELENPTEEKSA